MIAPSSRTDTTWPRYDVPRDTGVVTAWFDATRSVTRRENLERFASTMLGSGVPWVLVECAFGDADFELPAWTNPLRVRSRSVLWQKERLLNLAVSRLPPECSKVVWVDGDMLFESASWLVETSAALDLRPVVQPFTEVVRLARRSSTVDGTETTLRGFADVLIEAPDAVAAGSFGAHGHTGFAWAMRRELVEEFGLYDACVAGRGDHLMAHAFAGEWESECLSRITGGSAAHLEHAIRWAEGVYGVVRARIGRVRGRALHLWHGEVATRGYQRSLDWLGQQRFDPSLDLELNADGAWEWRRDRDSRSAWMREYFARRDALEETHR